MSKPFLLTALALALGAAFLYAMVLALLWWKQEALLFYPVPLPADHRLAREPDVHERTVQVDGASLSMLHLKLPRPRGVVFFLHGNAGNLASWFTDTDFWRQANFDLVMPDYRGFGKSSGRVTGAAQLRADVRAAFDSIAAEYAGRPLVLFGRSLGTGLAADLGEQLSGEGRAPALTVLVSPYASMRELSAEFYPWVPLRLLRYPLDTARHLPQVEGPILLLHGEQDTLIGLAHPQRLQRLVPRARLVLVPGAGHNDLQEFEPYRQSLRQALDRLN